MFNLYYSTMKIKTVCPNSWLGQSAQPSGGQVFLEVWLGLEYDPHAHESSQGLMKCIKCVCLLISSTDMTKEEILHFAALNGLAKRRHKA